MSCLNFLALWSTYKVRLGLLIGFNCETSLLISKQYLLSMSCSDYPVVIQNVLSRPSIFDGTMGISLVDDVVELRPRQLWINVQVNMISLLAI